MNENTTILGGQNYKAKLRDGSEQDVFIRQLTIRELTDKWGKMQGDEAELAELYCSKEKGWDDLLTPEAHEEIVTIGGDLNRPMFARWAERRRAEIAGLTEVNQKLLSASPGSSSPAGASLEKPREK
jgi:hypothetical protein